MIRTSLFTAAAAFCLIPAAQAHHEGYGNHGGYYGPQATVSTAPCVKQKKNDQVAGAVIGAVAGGLIGVAIGGELEPDNGFNRYKGYRGHRGYRGYRGYRGHRGHRRGFYHDRGDDGAEIAGGLIGGLVGAAIGSELASGSTDCARTYSTGTYNTGRQYGPYSGDVYAPTRSPTGPAWENPQRQQSASPPVPQPVSAPPSDFPDYGPDYGPDYQSDYPNDDLYGAPEAPLSERECTTVRRETRLPDGSVIREPVEVCQTDDGRWQMPNEVPNY